VRNGVHDAPDMLRAIRESIEAADCAYHKFGRILQFKPALTSLM
jgi:hypothetical protein